MTLLSIQLENFRNFPALDLSLDARGAVLEAPNGRGKTNFLEAIHYLSLFRSFRGAPDSELARYGEPGFRVRGEVCGAGGSRQGIGVGVQGARKRVSVDGKPARPADRIGTALSVILSPADIRLIQGSPGRRRRYLDVTLCLSSRRYLHALQEYGRGLRQRNRVLLDGGHPALLEPWTEQLALHGGVILEARDRHLARWGARFAEVSARIAGAESAALAWRYESTVSAGVEGRRERGREEDVEASRMGRLPESHASSGVAPAAAVSTAAIGEDALDEHMVDLAEESAASGNDGAVEADAIASRARIFADSLRGELERRALTERRRGMTLAGPHRDDISFHARDGGGAERDLRRYGSQGEQRTAALALRFLEAEVLTRERRELPIVLLDDVFSELDPRRAQSLLGFLQPEQQVFLTTPRPLAPELGLDLPRFTVESGRLRAA